MDEIFPVMAGVAIGMLMPQVKGGAMQRALLLCFLSVGCGATAAWITGEVRVSWIYVLIDTAQVAAAGLLMWALTLRWLKYKRGRERV